LFRFSPAFPYILTQFGIFRNYTWEEDRLLFFTPEERAASEERVRLMAERTKVRSERGLFLKKLIGLNGVRQ